MEENYLVTLRIIYLLLINVVGNGDSTQLDEEMCFHSSIVILFLHLR